MHIFTLPPAEAGMMPHLKIFNIPHDFQFFVGSVLSGDQPGAYGVNSIARLYDFKTYANYQFLAI